MPDAKEISIKLTARDETASAFESLHARINKFFESGKGEELAKTAIGGAVAIAALEGVAKGAEIAGTFLRHYTDAMEHAGTQAQRDDALFMSINNTFREQVPIIGH